MANFKARVSLTNISYAESLLHVVDDVVDDGRNLIFAVPLGKVKRFLRIMHDAGINVTKV